MAKVQRVLDLGCGWGGFATALEKRFPDGEVQGIDYGASRVRWAHHRAANMILAVNFAQRFGEDSNLDSGSFDIVTRGNPQFKALATVLAKAGQWADHRYNMERWAPEYRALDFPGVLRPAGFQVSIDPKRPGGVSGGDGDEAGVEGTLPFPELPLSRSRPLFRSLGVPG